jgi:hypothetical protein
MSVNFELSKIKKSDFSINNKSRFEEILISFKELKLQILDEGGKLSNITGIARFEIQKIVQVSIVLRFKWEDEKGNNYCEEKSCEEFWLTKGGNVKQEDHKLAPIPKTDFNISYFLEFNKWLYADL